MHVPAEPSPGHAVPVRLELLGPLRLLIDGTPVEVRGPKRRALLALLAFAEARAVSVDQLVDALWPAEAPDSARQALHAHIFRLRSQLGPAAARLQTRPDGYRLELGAGELDLTEARALAAVARARPPGVDALRAAHALWRGPVLADLTDVAPIAVAVEGCARLHREVTDALVAAATAAGEAASVLGLATESVAADPLREPAVLALVRALAATGQSPEALRVGREYRRRLADETGLDPSPALAALERDVASGAAGPVVAPPALRVMHDRVLRAELPTAPVAAPGLAAPPRLPHRPSPLVGRAAELDDLGALLSTRALVTLVGPGGVGKTRTALELAHRAAAEGRPVWWVDLVPVTAQRLVAAVADAVGVETRGDDPAEDLRRSLAARRGLLVLDNAEHLLDPLAALVERLLDPAAGGSVLVTSRERLALDIEVVRALAPFPVPADADAGNPAVQLFVQRAPGMRAASLAATDVALIARTCRHLDGLPLAIELGAARVHALGLPLLIERLGDRLDLLSGGRRTADRRHRTLRAVVEWSHELLTADEALLFARLPVFPGSFELDQVEAVCTDERLATSAIGPLLARLVEQSLLRRVEGRFTLLETLRAYAAEQLERAGERELLRRRHAHDTAGRLAAHMARLWTPEEPDAVAVLTELVDDLHAAFRHAVEHDRPLAIRLAGDVQDFAYFRQRLDLLDWGSTVAGWDDWEDTGPEASRALATAALAAWLGGRMAEAATLAERGVRAAGGPDAPDARQARKVCADLAMFAGRTEEAVRDYRGAARSWRAAGLPAPALLFELAATHALVNGGRRTEAAPVVEHLRAQAVGTANPTVTCWAHYLAGLVAEPEDPEGAIAAYGTAVRLGTAADCRLFVAMAQVSAAAVRRLAPDAALASVEDALDRWSRTGGSEMLHWWLLGHLVLLLADLGSDRDAALLAAAVLAADERRPIFATERARLAEALALVRGRLGVERTDAATARGAALAQPDAVAYARQAIAAARSRTG